MDPEPNLIDQRPEEIQQQIDQTRSALTDKLEQFEDSVKGTVGNAKETVEETIQNVRDTIYDTVASVKQTFDVEYQVRQRPWMMLGGAAVAGFAVGRSWTGRRSRAGALRGDSLAAGMAAASTPLGDTGGFSVSRGHSERSMPSPPVASHRSQRAGPIDRLRSEFQDEIDKVQAVAVGALMGLVRDAIKRALPTTLSSNVGEVMDSATSKLGGKPVPGPVVEAK